MDKAQMERLWTMYKNLQDLLEKVELKIRAASIDGYYASIPSLLQEQAGLVGTQHGIQLAVGALGYRFVMNQRTKVLSLEKITEEENEE